MQNGSGFRRTRKVCCVSLNFPPSSAANVHRVRHLTKHLANFHWQPTVICVDERELGEPLDWRLATLVPENVVVRKIRPIPLHFTRPLGITDLGLRAYWSLAKELRVLLKDGHYDVAFITGSPFYQMMLGNYVKRRFKIPIILDFQDPWVSTWGATQPTFSKAGITHCLARLLEPLALRSADYVTSVSGIQNAEMAARYPWLQSARMAAIPIGGDIDDFAAVRSRASKEDNVLSPGFVHLSYVGTFLPRSEPLVHVLLRAFAKLRSMEPALAARMRLNFVGTSNQFDNEAPYRVTPIAEEIGVADAVCEIPRRIPFSQALEVLAKSHGLLLIGSDEPHYTASKIYPALMSGRPFLSLFHRASSAHAILSASGGGQTRAFETIDQLAKLESTLAEDLRNLVLHPEKLGISDPAAYGSFDARNIARRFADIFDQIAEEAVA